MEEGNLLPKLSMVTYPEGKVKYSTKYSAPPVPPKGERWDTDARRKKLLGAG